MIILPIPTTSLIHYSLEVERLNLGVRGLTNTFPTFKTRREIIPRGTPLWSERWLSRPRKAWRIVLLTKLALFRDVASIPCLRMANASWRVPISGAGLLPIGWGANWPSGVQSGRSLLCVSPENRTRMRDEWRTRMRDECWKSDRGAAQQCNVLWCNVVRCWVVYMKYSAVSVVQCIVVLCLVNAVVQSRIV